jgi:hypothetical protein
MKFDYVRAYSLMRGTEMTNETKSPYEPRKPVLPKPSNVRSPKSSPYDTSGRPKPE